MKNFVKIKDTEGSGFAFIQKFPQISMEKLKAGIFDSHQIKEFIKDPMFDKALSKAELSAWQSLKSVVTVEKRKISYFVSACYLIQH